MKLVNLNGRYINPDTIIAVEDVNNNYEGTFIRLTTTGASEGSADAFEAHTMKIEDMELEEVVSILTGKLVSKKKVTKSDEAKAAQAAFAANIDDVLGNI